MAYTIKNYSGNQLTVVADGTIDTTLDIKLIGKNVAGYGEAQNDNFVWLLENFASASPPARAITGQVWFDSSSKKLKFYDSTKWKSTGGAEVSSTAPIGLSQGDFWWDTTNKQLSAWDGTSYVLVGPQAAGSYTTEMRSRTVFATGSGGAQHAIIEAVVSTTAGSDTVFIISADSAFDLDPVRNAIDGFTTIQQGITLRNTHDSAHLGQTQTDHRFWGTATNADRLGGYTAGDFIRSSNARFSTLVNFSDAGYTVGYPNERLHVFNDQQLVPTIHNTINDQIVFKTTVGSSTKTPLKLVGPDILPGETVTSNIGSNTLRFSTVYANVLQGTATQSDSLNVAGNYKTASTAATSGTIVARTSSDENVNGINVTAGSIKATYFVGTATQAYYADLAEKYVPDNEYEVGTVVMIGGENEITASVIGSRALGTISENPAYMMNSELENGIYVALKGRVPVKVVGTVKKGDRLVASNNGVAEVLSQSTLSENVFAIALVSSSDIDVKLIEAVIL